MTLIGSLCTGYAGLDMAVHQVFGGELAWVADNDPGAAAILAHHYPHVPNLGDITTVNWADVPPVDILTAGFPCQPVSVAGQRKGITDERWLFDDICAAISRMVARPRLLVLENVPGLLTANGGDAMARVVQGLAALGYVGRYRLVRASDAGAPHRRERVFILAWLAEATEDADRAACGERRVAASGQAEGGRSRPDAGGRGGASAPGAQGDGRYEGQAEPARLIGGDEAPADPARIGHGNAWPAGERGLPATTVAGDLPGDVDWGQYGPAIRRWEHVLGRRAPRPTEPGRNGERLSPRFVEWMMGLPEGHVTDVPGLTRNDQLKALGNGVVPQQAVYALRVLLARATAPEMAA